MTENTNIAITTANQESRWNRWTTHDTLVAATSGALVVAAAAMAIIPRLAHCDPTVCKQWNLGAVLLGVATIGNAALFIGLLNRLSPQDIGLAPPGAA